MELFSSRCRSAIFSQKTTFARTDLEGNYCTQEIGGIVQPQKKPEVKRLGLARKQAELRSRQHVAARAQAARRVGVHRADGVGAAGRAGRIRIVLDVVSYFSGTRRVRVRLLVFQRPLLLGAIHLAEVVDAGVFLCRIAGANKVRDRDGGQQTDDGNHDHDFHEREAGFA